MPERCRGAERGAAAALPRDGRIRRNGLCRLSAPAERPHGPGRARGRARPPHRRRADRGRRGGTHGCRGPRRGPGDRFHLPRRARRAGAPAGGQRPAPAGRRDPRRTTGPGRVPPSLRGAVSGVPLHRLERAAQPAPRASCARGAGPLDIAAMASAASVFEGRHDFSAFGGADGPPVRTVHAVRVRREGRLVTIDVRAECLPPGPGAAHGRRPAGGRPGNSGHGGPPGGDWPDRGRRSTGPRPPRRASASGASSSVGDERTTRKTRNEREDLYASRERDRATLVRRRRDGRDARPPRDADRARPRGQAQAHLRRPHGHRRPRDRAQRVADHRDPRQARRPRSTPATAAIPAASRRRPSVTCSPAGRRRSSAAP